MNQFYRQQVATLLERIDEEPRFLILVAGPRQSGKTTLVRQALAQIDVPRKYVAVDRFELSSPVSAGIGESLGIRESLERSHSTLRDGRWLADVWQQARRQALAARSKFVLVLDEIQAVPNWSATVKGLWDEDRHNNLAMHVVLLGSAPLVMQRGLTESLMGRFETIRTAHWSFNEMSSAFGVDLDEYLFYGGYPGSASLIGDPDRWREFILGSVLEPNVERDILAMERVDKPVLLKRLVELGAEFSGQILSFTKMLGQLDDAGNTTTLARYLDLLEKSGILAGLHKYEGATRRLRASSPKLNFLNTALMTASSSYGFQDARADRTYWGRLVETAVGAHLMNTISPPTRLHYWREGPDEVDFVLAREPKRLLIEVKSGSGRHTLRGVRKFKQRFKTTPHLFVGSDGVGLEEFFAATAQDWLDRT